MHSLMYLLHILFIAAAPRSGLGQSGSLGGGGDTCAADGKTGDASANGSGVGIKSERIYNQLLLGTLSLDSYIFN